MNDSIIIRPLKTHDEFHTCEDVQRAAWHMGQHGEEVPAHMLQAVQWHGGAVLGAFTPAGEMIGFVFGFLGTGTDEQAAQMGGSPYVHCSHMMGIVPAWQGRSVGYRLKLAQREHVLAQGLRLIVWTFDPLQSRNARLNIEKLGGICRRYIRNAYGELDEAINAGLPTDRFELEWWVDSPRVRARLEQPPRSRALDDWLEAGAQLVNPSTVRTDGLRGPGRVIPAFEADPILIEIPGDVNALKQADMELARAWRFHIRELCEQAFGAGYVVSRFVTEGRGPSRRSFYVLERGSVEELVFGEERSANRTG